MEGIAELELKRCRILVTPTSYGRTDPGLRERLERMCGEVVYNTTGKPLPSSELRRLLPGIDGYIAGLDEIDGEALAVADRLKVIARYGVGVDRVDLDAARERGIVVTNTPGANSLSVAELAVGLMLSLVRRIPQAFNATRAGGWPRMTGRTLSGKTVGLVGFGAVGRRVAELLRGFSCTVLAYDPVVGPGVATATGVQLVDLDELLHRSDVVSLHAPLTGQTRAMANERFFEKMKPGSYLVNTARGELVVESDLLRALESDHLAGAALDVFEAEPLPAESPLLHAPKLLVTPHMASHTDEATTAMAEMATADCLSVLRGEQPQHPVL